MADKARGLPSVPRGYDRDLTTFLQGLYEAVRELRDKVGTGAAGTAAAVKFYAIDDATKFAEERQGMMQFCFGHAVSGNNIRLAGKWAKAPVIWLKGTYSSECHAGEVTEVQNRSGRYQFLATGTFDYVAMGVALAE